MWKGAICFGKRGKLSLMYIKPYEIIERLSLVAYRLSLLIEFSRIHDVFCVSMLYRCPSDLSRVLEDSEVELRSDLTYEKQLVQIIDQKEEVLRNMTISLVNVLWRNHKVEETTWEGEENMWT